jgi:hypothetical protein
MNQDLKILLNHLVNTYQKHVLERVFGISAGMWRQHKTFVQTDGKSGTILSPKHYENVKKKYEEFLEDKLREVRDIDFSNNT